MIMECTQVVIVGAGPAGLSLGLALAKHRITSVILEKEQGITQDPRGVYLAEDAVRILYDLGIGHRMKDIGHVVPTINFHKTKLSNAPFLQLKPNQDILNQTVPDGILQVQPKLEWALREAVKISEYCELRQSCEVLTIEDRNDSTVVRYKNKQDEIREVLCPYLVGADGKKGVIRKKFLEPQAGIVQEPGVFPYEGTWIAANFKIQIPTVETHPNFPLWKLNYKPEDVYNLFWPIGWHFCSPPGTPVACGRFGPLLDRFWRHEISVPDWDDSMNSHQILMSHVMQMMTRSKDIEGKEFGMDVQFPFDCIQVIRCRPFRFAHRVVNKWFHNRTILIGDAAHVFPPFGGQGIACGIRDAHALSWRLALLLSMKNADPHLSQELLSQWSQERRQGVYDSSKLTTMSGLLCNEEDEGFSYFFRQMVSFLNSMPILHQIITLDGIQTYRAGYSTTPTGFHLPAFKGGIRLPQIYTQTSPGQPFLSDFLLRREGTIFTLFIVNEYPQNYLNRVRAMVRAIKIDSAIISDKSVVMIDPVAGSEESFDSTLSDADDQVVKITAKQFLDNQNVAKFYDSESFVKRIGHATKFVIARPDFIVFACAKSYQELQVCLQALRKRLQSL